MISFKNKTEESRKKNEEYRKKNEALKKIQKKLLEDKILKQNKEVQIIKAYRTLLSPFLVNNTYNSVIPLNMYTCWHTKELPPLMQQNYLELVINNPEFKHFIYDENECREFIKDNFDEKVLNAYNSLIPCSYKSDLWRFCILYINGGIYLDIKYKCVNGFKFIALTEKEYFVRDRPINMTYTALIVVKPQNPIMLKCINKIVTNVSNKYYGENALQPTGPGLLGTCFSKEDFEAMELFFTDTTTDYFKKEYMVFKNSIILTYYDEYRNEQKKHQKNKHYSQLWDERNIYI